MLKMVGKCSRKLMKAGSWCSFIAYSHKYHFASHVNYFAIFFMVYFNQPYILCGGFASELFTPLIYNLFFIPGFSFFKEKCLFRHVCRWCYFTNSFFRRTYARQSGLYWYMENCDRKESSVHWHAESRENTKTFGTPSFS